MQSLYSSYNFKIEDWGYLSLSNKNRDNIS